MDTQPTRRRQRRSSEMYPLVKSFMESDLSREAFCELHHISLSVLSYWQTKYRKAHGLGKSPGSTFLPLTVHPAGMDQAVMELELLSGSRLRFYAYPEVKYLQALLAQE